MSFSSPKKHCLFVAYDFPPCNGLGGALRSMHFAGYLPEFGWQPEVMALSEPERAYPQQHHVTRVPSATPFTSPYEMTPYGWAVSLRRHFKQNQVTHPVDLIYISCPPFPQAYTGLWLKRYFNCPLVVDFRDACSLDPYMEGSRLKKLLYSKIFPFFEKKILQDTDAFITNTPSMQKAYQSLYPFLKNKSILIPNGFDEKEFEGLNSTVSRRNKKFRLLYCGRFGIGGRSPRLILKTIQRFIQQYGDVLELLVVGDDTPSLKEMISRMDLTHNVRTIAPVPHHQALQYMLGADTLFLYQENTVARVSAVAGKTYEYLMTGKAILAVLPPGDNINLVEQFAKNLETVTDYNSNTLLISITRLYNKWKDELLPGLYSPDTNYLQNYSRHSLTKKLSQVFDKIADRTI